MKTIIRRNAMNEYELVVIDDAGVDTVTLLTDRPKNEPDTLVLPANPSNRKYFNAKKVDNAGGEVELTYKESKSYGHRTESAPRKGLEEWLDDDDRALYLELVEKAKANREAAQKTAKKAKTKAELEAELEAALAQLAALTKVEA